MKFTLRDLKKIQWFALLAALLIAAAVAAGMWTSAGARKAQLERDVAAAKKTEVEKRLARVRTEEQEIKARTQRFQQQIAHVAGNRVGQNHIQQLPNGLVAR